MTIVLREDTGTFLQYSEIITNGVFTKKQAET